MPGKSSTPATIDENRSRCGEITFRMPTSSRFIAEDLLQLGVVGVDEDAVLERVDPVVDRGQAREEAVDEAVDDLVQQPRRIVDRASSRLSTARGAPSAKARRHGGA